MAFTDKVLDLARTESGREFLLDLMVECGLFAVPEKGSDFDAGKRSIGAKVYTRLLTDGGYQLSLMFNERYVRLTAKSKRANDDDDYDD